MRHSRSGRKSLLKKKLFFKIVCGVNFLVFALAAYFLVVQANAITKSAYLASEYENRIKELTDENGTLEGRLSRLNSLPNMEKLVQGSDYEKIEKVRYIRVMEAQVAAK
ncbi:MAG: hypothetical protein ABIF89_01660 [bacterium]